MTLFSLLNKKGLLAATNVILKLELSAKLLLWNVTSTEKKWEIRVLLFYNDALTLKLIMNVTWNNYDEKTFCFSTICFKKIKFLYCFNVVSITWTYCHVRSCERVHFVILLSKYQCYQCWELFMVAISEDKLYKWCKQISLFYVYINAPNKQPNWDEMNSIISNQFILRMPKLTTVMHLLRWQ